MADRGPAGLAEPSSIGTGKGAGQKIGFEIPETGRSTSNLAYSLRNRPRPGISAITVILLAEE